VSSLAGGTVTVKSGTATVCTITLSPAGTGTCTLTATQFPVGTTHLTATYSGSTNFTPSTSAAKTLTVAANRTTKTALSLSAARVTYGDEQAEHVSVTVTSLSGTPGGTVAVKNGTVTECTFTLSSGKGSCTLTATKFRVGTHGLAAAYSGSSNFTGSASAAETLTVSKASTKTTLSLSASKVTYGHEQAERLSATVTPQYSGTPGGTVAVKNGTVTECTFTLSSGKGSCTLTATKFRVGTHGLAAAYSGDGNFTGSASASKTLTVVR
jgi:hypothetical protein